MREVHDIVASVSFVCRNLFRLRKAQKALVQMNQQLQNDRVISCRIGRPSNTHTGLARRCRLVASGSKVETDGRSRFAVSDGGEVRCAGYISQTRLAYGE
jgi:hypothetical protein